MTSTLLLPRRPLPRARLRPRVAAMTALTALALAAVVCAALSLGDRTTPPAELLAALVGTGADSTLFAVHQVRLPRVATALVVGAAFGIAGGITQSVLRNPIASPDILGVTGGASAAVVAVIAVGAAGGTVGVVSLPLAAIGGGLLCAAAVYALAWSGGVRGRRLLLVGIALSAAMTALTQYLLTIIDVMAAQRAAVWITGSLNAASWERLLPVAVAAGVLLPLVFGLAHTNRALLFDDDVAAGWGVSVNRGRTALVVLAVVLASVATSAAGPIAFAALVSGQVARRLARTPDIPPVLSGTVGALLVLSADTVGRTAFPVQLPVGVLTALIGAPFLLYLLQRGPARRS